MYINIYTCLLIPRKWPRCRRQGGAGRHGQARGRSPSFVRPREGPRRRRIKSSPAEPVGGSKYNNIVRQSCYIFRHASLCLRRCVCRCDISLLGYHIPTDDDCPDERPCDVIKKYKQITCEFSEKEDCTHDGCVRFLFFRSRRSRSHYQNIRLFITFYCIIIITAPLWGRIRLTSSANWPSRARALGCIVLSHCVA